MGNLPEGSSMIKEKPEGNSFALTYNTKKQAMALRPYLIWHCFLDNYLIAWLVLYDR